MKTCGHGLALACDELAVGVACLVLAVTAIVSLRGTLVAGGAPRPNPVAVTPVGVVASGSGRSVYEDADAPGAASLERLAVATHSPPSAMVELSVWVCSKPWEPASGACPGRALLVEPIGAASRSALVTVPPSMVVGDVVYFRFVLAGRISGGDRTLAVSMVPV